MGSDFINYLILLTAILGTSTIILNVVFLSRLGRSTLKKFGTQVLVLMIIFSVAGFLRSYQAMYDPESLPDLRFLEYSIYSLTYIAAVYSLYRMKEMYGFNVD